MVEWQITKLSEPKEGRKLLLFIDPIDSKWIKGVFTGFYELDKNRGRKVFVSDGGGRFEVQDVPLYSEVKLPTIDQINEAKSFVTFEELAQIVETVSLLNPNPMKNKPISK